MVLTLVKKELRETAGFVALAMVLYLVYVTKLTGSGGPVLRSLLGYLPGMSGLPPELPFVQDNFASLLFYIGAALAIALGFRQSAWEPHQGTALYLLHLPLRRRAIVLTKLLTGIGLLLVCTFLPILVYALWAAAPRTHPGPFEWSMTGPTLQTWMTLPVVYLGAFASGIRPARWFGSRLLPLFSVALPAFLCYALGPWWLIGFPIFGITAAVLVSDILWVAATRDY